MASVNKAILIGNLGKDPEIRYTQSGQAVTTFSIATTRRWRDKDGANQEQTDWHNIVVWGRQAENANQYLKKGSPVFIEGRIQTRNYEDKDGQKRWITEIVAQSVQFLGRPGESGGSRESSGAPSHQDEPPPDISEDDDDLPF